MAGKYPVVAGGQRPAYYINQFNRGGETITIAGSGAYAGFVMYWNEPIFVSDAFSIKTDETQLLASYAYYYLQNYWCPVNLFHKGKKNGADLAQRFAPNCAFLYYPILNAHNEQKYLF